MPCGFFVHSRRFHSDHKIFIDSFVNSVPQLSTKRVNIITDQEFRFAELFPVGKHLFCWNHMLRDLRWHARNKCNCTLKETNEIVNMFQQMMHCANEVDFDDQWRVEKSQCRSMRPNVLEYFERQLIPKFKEYGSIWCLKGAGVLRAESGVTNNPSESMNAVLHRLQKWKNVPLDVIVVSMYHLCAFYKREIERSMHQCGRWTVQDMYDFCKRDPAYMPRQQTVFNPKDIVGQVRVDTYARPSSPQENKSNHSDSRYSLAKSAINDNRVKLVGDGAFVVQEISGNLPRAVTLFPKRSCSCSSTKTCYHVLACTIAIGLEPHFVGKPNLSELKRRERVKTERPSGRKNPRKNDFESTSIMKLMEDASVIGKGMLQCNDRFNCFVTLQTHTQMMSENRECKDANPQHWRYKENFMTVP